MGLDQAVTTPAIPEAAASAVFAGVGFRAATTAAEIADLIARALREAGAAPADLAAIATAADRAGEPAIRAAAAAFGLSPLAVDATMLATCDARVPTRSARIERTRGVGSVAEAAALAAAGPVSHIVVPRIVGPGSTCALARPRRQVTRKVPEE